MTGLCQKTTFAFFFVFVCCAVGCGDPNGPQAVSGEVTFEGKPLPNGTIAFDPENLDVGAPGGAIITNGSYSLSAEKGLRPGKYKVRISSADEKSTGVPADAPPGSGPVARERIPAQYNTSTTLTAEVRADQKNVFNFPLK